MATLKPPAAPTLPKLKATSLYLPPEAHKELKLAAVERECTLSELLLATFRYWQAQGQPNLER